MMFQHLDTVLAKRIAAIGQLRGDLTAQVITSGLDRLDRADLRCRRVGLLVPHVRSPIKIGHGPVDAVARQE